MTAVVFFSGVAVWPGWGSSCSACSGSPSSFSSSSAAAAAPAAAVTVVTSAAAVVAAEISNYSSDSRVSSSFLRKILWADVPLLNASVVWMPLFGAQPEKLTMCAKEHGADA